MIHSNGIIMASCSARNFEIGKGFQCDIYIMFWYVDSC